MQELDRARASAAKLNDLRLLGLKQQSDDAARCDGKTGLPPKAQALYRLMQFKLVLMHRRQSCQLPA